MDVNKVSSTVSQNPGANPNYNQMLQDLVALRSDDQLLAQYLAEIPPPAGKIEKLLHQMKKLADKVEKEANGDTAITPSVESMIAAIQNALALCNQKNFSGISTLLEGGEDFFQVSLQNLIYYCTYPATPPPVVPADKQDMAVQLALLEGYLAQYAYDLATGDYNAADTIYGYVMTATQNLFDDGCNDPSIAPALGLLGGCIANIRALFLENPPNYEGCLELLESGALKGALADIAKFLSSS